MLAYHTVLLTHAPSSLPLHNTDDVCGCMSGTMWIGMLAYPHGPAHTPVGFSQHGMGLRWETKGSEWWWWVTNVWWGYM